MSSTTYLITGANRGLGRGLLEAYVQRPNTTVIAGVRDPSNESSKSLDSVKTGAGSKVITVKVDSNDIPTINEAIELLQSKHNITTLDVVIANAGIAQFERAESTPIKDVRNILEVNTIAPLALFQATISLLKKSPKPVFVGITSGLGSIKLMDSLPVPVTAYGMSKAALNFVLRKIHFENPELIAFPLNPGWVQTDMGNFGAKASGMQEAPVSLKDSIDGMVSKIDGATREATGGTLQDFAGTEIPW